MFLNALGGGLSLRSMKGCLGPPRVAVMRGFPRVVAFSGQKLIFFVCQQTLSCIEDALYVQ